MNALRAGFNIEEIFNLTKIDRWCLAMLQAVLLLAEPTEIMTTPMNLLGELYEI